MAIDPEITRNVELVRNATYGKDVREAIARGLELCYGYTSGETADEAARRANAAAEAVEGLIDDSQQAVHDVQEALLDLDHIVEVSQDTPTYSTNKIWIQPQDNTEYKIASFAAYETLWSRMNEIDSTYQQGHGGVVSITLDDSYYDPTYGTRRKKYIVSYSDGYGDEFYILDGEKGDSGPVDQIVGTDIFYYKMKNSMFSPTPPTTGWSSSLPSLEEGDYLWTITRITYSSGAEAVLYGLNRMGMNGADGRDGVDGSGAVDSVAIGNNGTPMVGAIKLPTDDVPTQDSQSLVRSGGVYSAVSNLAPKTNPAFTGVPTAPTADLGTNTTQIATTAFVNNAVNQSLHRQVELTMNSTELNYQDASITENTYCLFAGINPSSFPDSLSWVTTEGSLVLYTATAPTSPVTFTVVLFETRPSDF